MEDPSTSPSRAQQSEQNRVPEHHAKNTTAATSKYVRDFESLFVPINKEKLRNKAQNGNLRHCQFRSLCWRYFLHCLPEQYDDWLTACKESRLMYIEISKKHSNCIKSNVIHSDNEDDKNRKQHGQALDKSSAKDIKPNIETSDGEQEYAKASNEFDHSNIYKTIERDVIRTFPEMEFFRQTEMQNILGNILFNFANENTHLSYKQGMHELLATLLYVAHTDSQNCLINYEGDYANETIATLLDLKHLEHDVFHLFSALMKFLESWYQNDEILLIPDEATPDASMQHSDSRLSSDNTRTSSSKLPTSRHQKSSVLGVKLRKISEDIVKTHDIELFNHLEALQIAPQIYGIRWMRVLFGREYEFLDLLTVWDAIICDQDSKSLVDYVFASMLMTIREELINGDYTDCLNNLMRHQFKDVPYVIRLALHLRDPINNSRPKMHRQLNNYTRSTSYHQMRQQSSAKPMTNSVASSLTSKLSQQYISDKLRMSDVRTEDNRRQSTNQVAGSQRFNSMSQRSLSQQQMNDDRSRRIFSMTAQDKQEQKFHLSKAGTTISDGIGYLAQHATIRTNNTVAASGSRAGSKFLPNINRIVLSIGQNIQDRTSTVSANSHSSQWENSNQMRPTGVNQQRINNYTRVTHQSSLRQSSSHNTQSESRRQQAKVGDLILSPGQHQLKEYEMQVVNASCAPTCVKQNQIPHLGQLAGGAMSNSLDVSNESYEDLPTIVDYCWRLLSEQIDSLQRCLPKEKSLHSEDEIFVALAQLKKVRDVLKGSLRLEDELESNPGVGTGKN